VITQASSAKRHLTSSEFQQLAAVPAAMRLFFSLDNPRTRRAYQNNLEDFCTFVLLTGTEKFRVVTPAHILAWRAQLENRRIVVVRGHRSTQTDGAGLPVRSSPGEECYRRWQPGAHREAA